MTWDKWTRQEELHLVTACEIALCAYPCRSLDTLSRELGDSVLALFHRLDGHRSNPRSKRSVMVKVGQLRKKFTTAKTHGKVIPSLDKQVCAALNQLYRGWQANTKTARPRDQATWTTQELQILARGMAAEGSSNGEVYSVELLSAKACTLGCKRDKDEVESTTRLLILAYKFVRGVSESWEAWLQLPEPERLKLAAGCKTNFSRVLMRMNESILRDLDTFFIATPARSRIQPDTAAGQEIEQQGAEERDDAGEVAEKTMHNGSPEMVGEETATLCQAHQQREDHDVAGEKTTTPCQGSDQSDDHEMDEDKTTTPFQDREQCDDHEMTGEEAATSLQDKILHSDEHQAVEMESAQPESDHDRLQRLLLRGVGMHWGFLEEVKLTYVEGCSSDWKLLSDALLRASRNLDHEAVPHEALTFFEQLLEEKTASMKKFMQSMESQKKEVLTAWVGTVSADNLQANTSAN